MDVRIRPWAEADAEGLAAIANNIRIWNQVRDQLPHPYTIEHARQWIQLTSQQNPVTAFCVEANQQVVGSIGLVRNEDVYRKNIEIGYFIGENWWGKGMATAAVNLLVEFIIAHFEVVRIYAMVFQHNRASIRVLEKNGFQLECTRKKAVYKNGVLIDDQVWVKFV